MSALRILTCDGKRGGIPCGGALIYPPEVVCSNWERVGYAVRAGWTGSPRNGIGDVCPIPGHDHQGGTE